MKFQNLVIFSIQIAINNYRYIVFNIPKLLVVFIFHSLDTCFMVRFLITAAF